ncbi:A/G-specific adenine glycosylase [Paraperlucidibaca wandonensis]|uniref:Adenine DNA glycosylase n=1 Tax=Paraperlucidibaca wandonensis TaxID=1268273 RepID=A0ABW3HJ18_9GAMM
MTSSNVNFSDAVLAWFDHAGRKHLPWQQNVTPYRVWVSEIMLQQTQVSTALPYFQRFMASFPTLADLASASIDDVLHHWTGLGYYARGRNLHKAALLACERHDGQLPASLDELVALPGIGRSTAGAILSLGFGQRAVILDGNVKRVLARYHALAGDPAKAAVATQFWSLADALTPSQRCGDYTQAMMDLGATLCTRTKPACERCPVQDGCIAYAQGEPARYPEKQRKQPVPRREVTLAIHLHDDQAWMAQRPSSGIWGGLWSFPEWPSDTPLPTQAESLPEFVHVFSHFRLNIKPVIIQATSSLAVSEAAGRWVTLSDLPALGFPAPIYSLLQRLGARLEASS